MARGQREAQALYDAALAQFFASRDVAAVHVDLWNHGQPSFDLAERVRYFCLEAAEDALTCARLEHELIAFMPRFVQRRGVPKIDAKWGTVYDTLMARGSDAETWLRRAHDSAEHA